MTRAHNRRHSSTKGLTNDESDNIDARAGTVVDVTHAYIRRHVTAGDFFVASLFPRCYHSPFLRRTHGSLSKSFRYIHTRTRSSGKGGGERDRVGWKTRGLRGRAPRHTEVIRPSEWRGQRGHFIIECHYPWRSQLVRNSSAWRAAIIFSRVSPRYIATLIYVMLHLTVPRTSNLHCQPPAFRRRASSASELFLLRDTRTYVSFYRRIIRLLIHSSLRSSVTFFFKPARGVWTTRGGTGRCRWNKSGFICVGNSSYLQV